MDSDSERSMRSPVGFMLARGSGGASTISITSFGGSFWLFGGAFCWVVAVGKVDADACFSIHILCS